MPKPEAIAAVMLRIHRELDSLLSRSEKIIMEFANMAETIIAEIRIFNVNLNPDFNTLMYEDK
ncbi:MAG TPA: hypothetical protein VFS97_14820 [Nitrososphaeraceae archaeon]|jgi:hypothetical protein|nr:hypothetical protein [Nitrososphaeraceae archaeon]